MPAAGNSLVRRVGLGHHVEGCRRAHQKVAHGEDEAIVATGNRALDTNNRPSVRRATRAGFGGLALSRRRAQASPSTAGRRWQGPSKGLRRRRSCRVRRLARRRRLDTAVHAGPSWPAEIHQPQGFVPRRRRRRHGRNAFVSRRRCVALASRTTAAKGATEPTRPRERTKATLPARPVVLQHHRASAARSQRRCRRAAVGAAAPHGSPADTRCGQKGATRLECAYQSQRGSAVCARRAAAAVAVVVGGPSPGGAPPAAVCHTWPMPRTSSRATHGWETTTDDQRPAGLSHRSG